MRGQRETVCQVAAGFVVSILVAAVVCVAVVSWIAVFGVLVALPRATAKV